MSVSFNMSQWFSFLAHKRDATLVSNGVVDLLTDSVVTDKPVVGSFKVLIAGYSGLTKPVKKELSDFYGGVPETLTALVINRADVPVIRVGARFDVVIESETRSFEAEYVINDYVSRHIIVACREVDNEIQ